MIRALSSWWHAVRTGLLAAVLLAIPCLLIHEGLEVRRAEKQHLARIEDEFKLDKMANSFSVDGNLRLLAQVLGELVARAERSSDQVAAFAKLRGDLQKTHPGVFELLVFDREGKRAPGFDAFPEWDGLIASFGECLKAFYRNDIHMLRRSFHHFRPILGPFMTAGYEISIGRGLYLRSFLSHRQYLFHSGLWYGKEPSCFVIVFMSVTPELPLLGFRLSRDLLRQWYPELSVEIVDLELPLSRWRVPPGMSRFTLRRRLLEMDAEDGRSWFDQGRIWRQASIDARRRFVFSLPESGFEFAARETQRNRTMLLGAWALLLFAGWVLRPQLADLSLRIRLLVLFCFTTGIPLLLLGYIAIGLTQDRRDNLQKRAFLENSLVIERFAAETFRWFGSYESVFRAFASTILPPGEAQLASAVQRLDRCREETHADAALLSDGERRMAYQYITPAKSRGGSGFEGVYRALAPIFSLQLAQRIAALNQDERPFLETAKDQAVKATLESYGIELDQLLCRFEDSVYRVFSMNLGGERTGMMSFFLRTPEGRRSHGGIAFWSQPQLNRLLDVAASEMRRLAPGLWLSTHEQNLHLDRNDQLGNAARMMGIRMNDWVQCHERVQIGSQPWLMSAGSVDLLTPAIVFCARPEEPILRGERRTIRALLWIALLLLLSGVFAALLLSHHLLRPVQQLEVGMQAIRRRDFRARISVASRDELGRLGETFNMVMEGLSELEVAKVVQETFFPAAPLAAHGWQIAGECLTAGRVGGDYFDYLQLPDERLLFLIGDVSGHGTAAALVVALAKAVVCHPSTPPEPAQILQMLNDQLVQSVGRRKMMTCFVALFDPRNGTLTASNAGHNYPMLCSSQGVVELRIEHLLLGARSRQPFPEEQRLITDDGFLCLYSDGLIETLDRSGHQIGYQPLIDKLPSLRRSSAPETVSAILQWRASLAASEALDDDVTVMVLQRSA